MKPISTIEGSGFRELLSYVEPNYAIPSRPEITRRIDAKVIETKTQLKSRLEEVKYVAITANVWSNSNMEGFLGTTVQYISGDFEMKSHVLSVRKVHEKCTGENLSRWLNEVAFEYGIQNKIVALVTDNGSEVLKARQILEKEKNWKSVSCATDTIQLCLNPGFAVATLARALSSARRLVEHFNRSVVATEALEEKCLAMKVETCELITDLTAQWRSTYEMVRRLVQLQGPVLAVLNDPNVTPLPQAATLDVLGTDWEILKALLPILKPVYDAVRLLECESCATISAKVPFVQNNLSKTMESSKSWDLPAIAEFKRTLLAELNSRFLHDWDDIACISSIIDIRFKPVIISGLQSDVEQLQSLLEQEMMHLNRSLSVVPYPTSETDREKEEGEPSGLAQFVSDDCETTDSEILTSDTIREELQRYMECKSESSYTDPLAWWKANQLDYPHLAELATKCLCVPATSTAFEKLFSVAGQTARDLKSSMTGDRVEALVFLKGNSQL